MTTHMPRARILVADDSRFMRRLLSTALTSRGFDVVGEAADGDETLALCERLRPDALTLDLAMPGMDGLAVLRHLRGTPPAVVVSAFSPAHGARAVDALAEGAFDLAAKPSVDDSFDAFADDLAAKLIAAAMGARSGPMARRPAAPAAAAPPAARRAAARAAAGPRTGSKVVVIATSTGGPKALGELVPALPATLGAGTLIVQHMPPGFTGLLAQRLDKTSRLNVREATGGEALAPGHAYIAPGGRHLRLTADRRLELGGDDKIGGVCPRADLTIADAAKIYGRRMVLAVLTGMGKDGLQGAEAVHRAGGRVLVEDASSCTVYGMPRAVEEAGLAHHVVPLPEMAAQIALEASR
jgi:two-component system, chemotaxis family, protein-glutamate methylesterase/glutaminase